MKRFYLILTTLFLFTGMTWADDVTLALSDAQVIWNDAALTWDSSTGTMYFNADSTYYYEVKGVNDTTYYTTSGTNTAYTYSINDSTTGNYYFVKYAHDSVYVTKSDTVSANESIYARAIVSDTLSSDSLSITYTEGTRFSQLYYCTEAIDSTIVYTISSSNATSKKKYNQNNNDIYGNSAIGWLNYHVTDLSAYNALVVKLQEASDEQIEVCVCEDGYWNDSLYSSTYITAGETEYMLALTKAKRGDGNHLDLKKINLIFLRTNWTNEQTIKLDTVYLTYIAPLDYEEIDYSAGSCVSGSNAVADSTYMNITFGDNRTSYWGWTISDSTNVRDYRYLVVVPRIPYSPDTTYVSELGTGATSEIQYSVSDGTNEIGNWDWGFAYGEYQRRRACVLDLDSGYIWSSSKDTTNNISSTTTLANQWGKYWKDLTDSLKAAAKDSIENLGYTFASDTTVYTWSNWLPDANLKTLKMCCLNEGGSSYEISAIYFTNTAPTYFNEWNGAGDATWDYTREATTMGTYGTVCLPYASAICGARTYDVVGYGTDESGNPSELYLQEVYGVLEAGKAYVYKTVATTVETYQAEGNVTFTKAGAITVDSATTGNALVGTLGANGVSVDSTCYILFADSTMEENGTDSTAVYKWGKGTGNTVAQYRAYLDLSVIKKSSNSQAKANGWISMSLAYDGDDGTTGIKEIVSEEQKESVIDDDAIYNLSGVRVTNPQKGIYIKNGKKYIIK